MNVYHCHHQSETEFHLILSAQSGKPLQEKEAWRNGACGSEILLVVALSW